MEETVYLQAAAIGGMVAVLVIVGIAAYVISVIGLWKVFVKAGQPGWKSIIPIYNAYVMYEFSWTKTYMFWITLGLGIVSAAFQNSEGFMASVAGAASFASVVIMVMLNIRMARAFGKGAGFAVGLTFLPFIFTLILGFGDARYVGVQE